MRTYVIFFLMLITSFANSQDNLQLLYDEDQTVYPSYFFKGTKIVNGQSVELRSKGVLQFQIQHRFGTLNSGFYNLYGLDNSRIRLGVEYGFKNWLSIGVARSSDLKTIDLNTKYRLIRQMNGSKSFLLLWF